MISCYRGIAATFTLSNIFLEYDTVLNEKYLTMIGELYAGGTSISHTNVTSIHN